MSLKTEDFRKKWFSLIALFIYLLQEPKITPFLTQIFDKKLVLNEMFPNMAFKRGKTILFVSVL